HDLLYRLSGRGEPFQSGDASRSGAALTGSYTVAAIAAEHDLILVTGEEGVRVILVAQQPVQSGARRGVGVYVGVIGKQPVGDSPWGHRAFRIHHLLVVVAVDIAPPGLGVADEFRSGILRHHLVEPLDPHIERVVLEM